MRYNSESFETPDSKQVNMGLKKSVKFFLGKCSQRAEQASENASFWAIFRQSRPTVCLESLELPHKTV